MIVKILDTKIYISALRLVGVLKDADRIKPMSSQIPNN